jgi:hypothetical protein
MNVNDIKMKTIEENNNSNSNSNNNSNNTYTKSAIEVLSINRFTTDSYSSEIDQKKDYSFKYGPKSNNDYKLFPIPLKAIQANSNLTQNPGY